MPRQDKVFVCFQKAEDDTHKLYIYDDVTAYGTFNWSTWSYEESETSAKYFQEQLAAIPDTGQIDFHLKFFSIGNLNILCFHNFIFIKSILHILQFRILLFK